MISENIGTMIMESMKAHDQLRTGVLRVLKSKFLEWKTSEKNIGKTMSESDELGILRKLYLEYLEDSETFKGRPESTEYLEQAKILESYIPKGPSENDLKDALNGCPHEITKKNMKSLMDYFKQKFPAASGKELSEFLNKQF